MHRVSWEEVDGDPTLVISTVSCVHKETRIFLLSFSHFVESIRMFSLSLSLSRSFARFRSSCSCSLRLSFWKPSADLPSLSVRPYIRPFVQPAHQPTLRPFLSLIRRKRSIHHGRLRVPTFLGRQSWAFQNCGYRPSTSSLVVPSHVYFRCYIWYISACKIYMSYCFKKKKLKFCWVNLEFKLLTIYKHVTYFILIIFNIKKMIHNNWSVILINYYVKIILINFTLFIVK